MMALFWILIAAMVVASLVILVRHLVVVRQVEETGPDKPSVSIFRQRLQELEQEKEDGLINDEQLHNAKTELEQSLLDEVNAPHREEAISNYKISPDWKTAGLITVLLPVLAVSLYYWLGQPGIIEALRLTSEHSSAATREEQLATVEQMVDSLAERLRNDPDDLQGWSMLARSYKVLGRYADAVAAYEHVYSQVGDDAGVLLQYADTLAMANGGSLAGRPEELILRALELSPQDSMGLWLAGMAARERGDNETALNYWETLLPQVQGDAESYQEVRQLIHAARQDLGIADAEFEVQPQETTQQGQAAGGKNIRVYVSLEAGLADSANPEDVLFIFARAVSGPPMPLAVARMQVKDLPVDVVLDDSMAMMPALKLSGYDNVQVNARISRSGTPTASSGDLMAESVQAKPGQEQPIKLVIDTVVQ